MKNNRTSWLILIILAIVISFCLAANEEPEIITDNLNTLTFDNTTDEFDPNTGFFYPITGPPKPKYKCPVHGVIDSEKEFILAIYINMEEALNVCYRCYAEFVKANLPELIKLETE